MKKAKVPVGEWVADVQSHHRPHRADTERKVKTTGLVRLDMGDVMPRMKRALRQGQEVRFCDRIGDDVLRFYPCLDANFTGMFVAAQTMGALRSCVGDIPFRIVRRDGMDVDEAKAYRAEKQKEIEALRKSEVTPSKMVKCPECGCEFRVGKALASLKE